MRGEKRGLEEREVIGREERMRREKRDGERRENEGREKRMKGVRCKKRWGEKRLEKRGEWR